MGEAVCYFIKCRILIELKTNTKRYYDEDEDQDFFMGIGGRCTGIYGL